MRLEDFDFDLPEELIALRPLRPRPASRLLVADGPGLREAQVADLPEMLRPGDMLVFNDTKVIPARLFGERHRQSRDGSGIAKVEALLLSQEGPDTWRALMRPAKRLAEGDRLQFSGLGAEVAEKAPGGEVVLRFALSGPALEAAIAEAGEMPLPPYIAGKRPADARDREDYQTIFAARPGAVAAPTAALHFDDALMARLTARGVLHARLTLHVGAGTFLPVKVDDISKHRMHGEWGEITPETAAEINAARAASGRIIAVGTTALRLLETATEGTGTQPFQGETDIFIRPGHVFRGVDG
ncbi:MAG: tRNA preQ1(34) S-adenosylmethionine ribosyltransferase-isomerase QueA, partial [Pseudomonadota bacterium]